MFTRVIHFWQVWVDLPWLTDRKFEFALSQASPYVIGRLLDVGCNRKPYRKLYAESVRRHIGVDFTIPAGKPGEEAASRAMGPDVLTDAHHLPFCSESFDTVLCTHVLVHLKEPSQAIGEMSRVLREGGCLVLSARQMWHVYIAEDYFRFTESGLRYLAEKNGLEVLEVFGVGGFFSRLGVKLTYFLHSLNRRWLRFFTTVPLGILIVFIQGLFYFLDSIFPTPNDVVFNVLVARKGSQ